MDTNGPPAQPPSPPVPVSAGLATAAQHTGDPELRSASRLGFLGVWMRRLVRRLTRFQSEHQRSFNEGVVSALRDGERNLVEVAAHLGEVSRSLQNLVDTGVPAMGAEMVRHGEHLAVLSGTLAQVVEQSLPKLGSHLGDVSRTLDAVVTHTVPSIGEEMRRQGEHMAAVSRTVEQLQAAHGAAYETSRAQGRHLDELHGRIADFGEVVGEADALARTFEKRVASEVERLASLVGDLEHRFRPNLHFDHFDFARKHRGDEEELTRRMAKYAVLFGPVRRILDVGCGRGEFLQACSEAGVGAYGIDADPDMVSRCSMASHNVVQGDALEHLRSLPDRSLDGIFSSQVVEHLTSSEIVDLIGLAAQKLKRGAIIILETINPDTFSALRWFWMDPTHRQPVASATLRYLLEDAGCTIRDVLHSSPVPEEEALQRVSEAAAPAPVLDALRAYNRNVEKLNRVLFGDQDYAVIAER